MRRSSTWSKACRDSAGSWRSAGRCAEGDHRRGSSALGETRSHLDDALEPSEPALKHAVMRLRRFDLWPLRVPVSVATPTSCAIAEARGATGPGTTAVRLRPDGHAA